MFTYIAGRIGEHILGAVLITVCTVLIKETVKECAKTYYKMKLKENV